MQMITPRRRTASLVQQRALFRRAHFKLLAEWWKDALAANVNITQSRKEALLVLLMHKLHDSSPSFRPVIFLNACGYSRAEAEALLDRHRWSSAVSNTNAANTVPLRQAR